MIKYLINFIIIKNINLFINEMVTHVPIDKLKKDIAGIFFKDNAL